MGSNKLGTFIVGGALLGAAVSMLDRSTRQQTVTLVRTSFEKAMYYKENPDVMKKQLTEKKDQVQTLIEQVKGDVEYVKSQVDEIKTLTPQVKEMFADTKEAFADSKSEYEQIIDDEANTSSASESADDSLPPMVQKKNVIPLETQ
ncbi:YtxH domain-containing protein [Sporosarcina sp. PTS2304]|uniref:YtxH domain-containing protein n=1 Tax=Sporosarcina sp. PTS2304 TaxID=2283194 RepID=UPI000E0DD220|nr:YtxH domain-containing protein [Sporosarcina sp. PTS2304]AXH99939.1 YtxH domain-containing protein [Sporosarcina sp. PTS2304]